MRRSGQRTRKVKQTHIGPKTFVYHYNVLGNLIAETREDGSLIRAYVWVNNRPLAQIKHKRNTHEDILSYLHTDQLNTPRLATNPSQTVVWRWESRAFGNFKIDKDPDGNGVNVNVRLRFPGQFKDGESGLYYNWNRYYDPAIGRYVTSDPIGLLGGVNTYGYVGQNPVVNIDPTGLDVYPIPPESPGADKSDSPRAVCIRNETQKCALIGIPPLCGYICSGTVTTGPGAVACALLCAGNVNFACSEMAKLNCAGLPNDDAPQCKSKQ